MKYLFNPATDSFEALEPTLRDRFMLGGRVNFSEGSDFLSVEEIQSLIPDELKDTLKPGKTKRARLLFSPSGIKRAYDRGFKKRFAKLKLGLTYLRELDNELKGLDFFPNSRARAEWNAKFAEMPEVKTLLKEAKFNSIEEFRGSPFSKKNYILQTVNSFLKGEAMKRTGVVKGDLKNFRTGPIGQVDKIIVNKLLTDVLGDNAQFFVNEGSLPNEIALSAQTEGRPDLKQTRNISARYRDNLKIGFGSDEARKIYNNQTKTALRTKNLNQTLGLTDNINLRFARTHYFPVLAGGEMKKLNLLADGVHYSEKYTFRPSYLNMLQNVFYDGPVKTAVDRYKSNKINIKQLASQLDDIATKFKRNFPEIEIAELKLNKNNKFSFKKDFPSITNESRLNKIALVRNAINELENAYVASTKGAMDDTKFNQLKKDYSFVNEKYRNIYQPVFTQENIEIIRTRPTLAKKILGAVGKTIKVGGKVLGPLSVVAGSFAVGTAVEAGERDVFDLAGAYVTATPEVALINRRLRQDEQFAEKYKGTLPEIVSEDVIPMTQEEEIEKIKNLGLSKKDESAIVSAVDPGANDQVAGLLEESGSPYMQFLQGGGQLTPEEFNQLQSIPQSDRPLTGELDLPEMDQTMMAAQGGRVGFQDGTPNPIFDQIVAALNNTDLIENLEQENKQTLEEQIYGTEGDRTMMQRFNTMFADPRAIPYYASKIVEGATRIPEYAVRTVPALAIAGYDLATQRPEGKMDRFMKAISPSVTDAAQEKIGLTSLIEEQEKNRTAPQQFTGGVLELAGELPGPVTPIGFLLKTPKYIKELRNLAGGAQAAKELERKIEERVVVDQGRRDFNKVLAVGGVMGLLKSLGLDKLIGAGAKVAQKAAPEIITKGGTPKYFFDFVNLIKTKGDDITDKASTIERQKVYDYEGYRLEEDMTTGGVRISKETEGGATYSIGDDEYETVEGIIRKEEINYEPPETILDDAGKPKEVPDSYDEATLRPDAEGDLDDIDSGLDSIDEILDLLAKDGKKYTYKELSDMGLNLEGLGKDRLQKILKDPEFVDKIFKAGGGIVKLAGADSGPPPKSGPTPHGLPYVAKNVRPIKERR